MWQWKYFRILRWYGREVFVTMSRVEGFKMFVRLSGGRDFLIEAHFMVIRNKDRHYPILSLPDDVNGVSYRTGPRGWMDTRIISRWILEERVMRPLPHDLRRVFYMDNWNGHITTEDPEAAFKVVKTDIRYFPPNTTHLIQPSDSFIIQKLKMTWTTRKENYKLEQIRKRAWFDTSDKIYNPGTSFSLDWRRVVYARSICNMMQMDSLMPELHWYLRVSRSARKGGGRWQRLTPQQQDIVHNHRGFFHISRESAMKE